MLIKRIPSGEIKSVKVKRLNRLTTVKSLCLKLSRTCEDNEEKLQWEAIVEFIDLLIKDFEEYS